MTLKVSVVVPVYNPGPYLERCVEGLISQTMPAQDYEVIFVDDGSTDASPGRLDELAEAWPQVRVIHQENSGWAGKPRNVGIDDATGTYVFFCDADDWLDPQALTRLYDFAEANHSDVVLPKMAGFGRPIPHHAFRKTLPTTSLADGPLMESLTPHKLFRRSFLDQHHIRFPEGVRRLEDHYFVVTAYLLAEVVSIYADHTCYTHIRRDDAGNISSRAINWAGYYDNLAEAVEVVEQHTAPGPLRDRILRRWLHAEMASRLSGQRLLKLDRAEAESMFEHAHRVARAHFGPAVVQLLQPVLRPVGQAIVDGDRDRLWQHAEAMVRWRSRADALQLGWHGSTLQISGILRQYDEPREEDASRPPEARFLDLLREVDRGSAVEAFRSSTLAVQLTERDSGEQWPVTPKLHRAGLAAGFTADVDLLRAAGGQPLPPGTWEVHAHFRVLGFGNRVALKAVPERTKAVATQPTSSSALGASAQSTGKSRAVTLQVGAAERRAPTQVRRVLGTVRQRVRRAVAAARAR